MMRRLEKGGAIDRADARRFTFDGRSYEGVAGDTLASALLANGVKLVGRSFKYHRPRGVFTAGPEEPNALVELRGGARREPNTKATTVELYDGLDAASQNRWPSLEWDIRAAHRFLAPLLSAGFYSKTFMWPAAFWEKLYEPLIRRAAGLGRASGEADPDTYEAAIAFADMLVIGAGPAGISAALAAARAGARVILCDDDFRLGGRLLSEKHVIDGRDALDWANDAIGELQAMPEVRIFRRTQVFGAYDGGEFGALERVADHVPVPPAHTPRQRYWRFIVKRAVIATGAIERPIAFADNDRPGIMLSSAARSYVNRFAVRLADKAVVFASSDDGWASAFDLAASGAVTTIVDPRDAVAPELMTKAGKLGIRRIEGHVVGSEGGRHGVRAAIVETAQGREALAADLIAVAGGFNPAIGIATHLGAFFSFHSTGACRSRISGAGGAEKLLSEDRCAGTRMMICCSITICQKNAVESSGDGVAPTERGSGPGPGASATGAIIIVHRAARVSTNVLPPFRRPDRSFHSPASPASLLDEKPFFVHRPFSAHD
ncbi:MAG: (2Fe-2S)-binding protein [Alphaproteobacteria bacterium]|nr:(2Fe-2S)-binding protein [Alphaproteobacteria bacterium]